jgi:hypothetical protein
MKNPMKKCMLLSCIVLVAFAVGASRIDNDHSKSASRETIRNYTTPYRAPSRQGDVLFVEDPGLDGWGPAVKPDPVWTAALTDLLGAGNFGWFGPTENISDDGPPLDTLLQYQLVIWNCYDHWFDDTASLTDVDVANLTDYFLAGGKVWLIGQDALWSGLDSAWMNTYFHLTAANQDYAYSDSAINVHGLAEINCFSMETMSDYQGNFFFTDELIPDTSWACHGVLEDTDSNKVVGIFYPGFGDWQSSFWSIDLRDSTLSLYWSEILSMVGGMLTAFEITGVEENIAVTPERLQLNISPDPFVNTTTISFAVPNATNVSLTIYNRIGQHVTTLMNEHKQEGAYNVNWNRKDARGVEVPNGVYFVRLTCGDVSSTANIVIAR